MIYTNYKYYVYIFLFLVLFSSVYSQSMQDLQKMKAEYDKFQKSQGEVTTQINVIDPVTGLPKQAKITPYQLLGEEKDSVDMSLKHFGYDFFTRRDTVSFWENLPTPANYLLGPGDELVISLWGGTQLRETYIISRDGKIYDEKVGLMNLMGKTIEDAEQYLNSQFGRVYSTVKGPNPTTYMDISLGQLRSINVNFVGEVTYPGVYPIHPFSTLITGLIQAGGVDTTGTLRNIYIQRDGKISQNIDLYDYLLKGDLPANIQLRDQDVVVVPVRQSSITIDSLVVRTGIYEAKSGETVKQMISYAGGLKPNASSLIGIERIIPLNERNAKRSSTENYYIDYASSQMVPVQNGDTITVKSIFNTLSQVEIIGQVKSPGVYHYYKGMKLKDLIQLGGGYNDTTFWKSVYHASGELVRRDPESRYETVITIDLNKAIIEDNKENLPLENLDRFVVHANLNFFEKQNVQILGEVNIPGSYPLISDKETLRSLLNRAGGLTSKALPDGVSIFRTKKYFDEGLTKDSNIEAEFSLSNLEIIDKNVESNKKKDWIRVAWQNENIALMPGDSVIVKETTGTVNISGEIYNPGLIEYQKGKSLRYYINSAGGITTNGNNNDVIVIYANGVVVPKKFLRSPTVKDGSTIIVNEKEIKEPFDVAAFSSSMLSIISTTVTILVLSQQLDKGN